MTEEIEAKISEFRKLVDEMWEKHDIEAAMAGEGLIKAVKENIGATKRLRLLAEELNKVCVRAKRKVAKYSPKNTRRSQKNE